MLVRKYFDEIFYGACDFQCLNIPKIKQQLSLLKRANRVRGKKNDRKTLSNLRAALGQGALNLQQLAKE